MGETKVSCIGKTFPSSYHFSCILISSHSYLWNFISKCPKTSIYAGVRCVLFCKRNMVIEVKIRFYLFTRVYRLETLSEKLSTSNSNNEDDNGQIEWEIYYLVRYPSNRQETALVSMNCRKIRNAIRFILYWVMCALCGESECVCVCV